MSSHELGSTKAPGRRFVARLRRPSGVAAAFALTILVAGCGSSSGGENASGTSSADLTAANSAVQAAYKGTYGSPPSTPTTPPSGKNIWVLSCGQAAIGCSTLADSAVSASKAAGFDVTLVDGKFGADNAYSTGIRQAIAAKADGIVVGAIDCPAIKAPLQEAKAAGIKVVGQLTVDCDDPSYGSGDPLFSASIIYNDTEKTAVDYSKAQGKIKADWIIAQTKGDAVAVSMRQTDGLLGTAIADGFDDEMKAACPSCKVIPLEYTLADQGSGALPAKMSQVLLANPKVNAVMVPYDTIATGGVAQAIVRSGRSDDISMIGGEGYPDNLGLIKNDGGQDAVLFESTEWMGWAAVDSLSRLFGDQTQEPAGIGNQLFDKDHMPKTDDDGYIVPTVDFQADYLKAWGK